MAQRGIDERVARSRRSPWDRGDSLLAVVPAHNEEGTIADVVAGLRALPHGCDVMVVDDGSGDRTASRASQAGAHVVSLPYNLGIGGAVQTGFIYARRHGYAFMAQVDGDGQHDPAELSKLVGLATADPSIDVICGSRFIDGAPAYRAPAGRRAGIRIFARALTLAVGQRVTDPTSGFRLFNRRAIELFADDYPQDYPEVEALLMLHRNRLRFREVAVQMHQRRDGRSSITALRSGHYMLKVALALLAGLLRQRVEARSELISAAPELPGT